MLSLDIARAPREVIRRPWTGELDAKSSTLVCAHERRHGGAKVVHAIVSHEECRVQNGGARLLGRGLRGRLVHRVEGAGGQVVERVRRDRRGYASQFLLARRVQLAGEQVALPGRWSSSHLCFERGNRRTECTELTTELVIEPEDAHTELASAGDVRQQCRQLIVALVEHNAESLPGTKERQER